MHTATLALALAVIQEGSVRGAARLLDRSPSSVADAFERFETALALRLASRSGGSLLLTLAGENVARSVTAFCDCLGDLARLSGAVCSASGDALGWASRNPISVVALQNFASVAHSGSIRKTARDLGIGQPNLSRQIGQLEKVIDQPLLKRHTHGCEVTAVGLALSHTALALTVRLADLTGPANSRFAQGMRTVKLGTIIPIGHKSRLAARLARLVAAWQAGESRQTLFISSTTAEDLIEGLRTGHFDIALTDIAILDKRFEAQEVFGSELVLVAASSAVAPGADIGSVVSGRLIAVPSLRSGLRQKISEALKPWTASESRPARLVEIDALSIIINLVLDHGYLTVLPLDAVSTLGREIAIIRFPEAPQVRFHLVWQRSPAARQTAMKLLGALIDA